MLVTKKKTTNEHATSNIYPDLLNSTSMVPPWFQTIDLVENWFKSLVLSGPYKMAYIAAHQRLLRRRRNARAAAMHEKECSSSRPLRLVQN